LNLIVLHQYKTGYITFNEVNIHIVIAKVRAAIMAQQLKKGVLHEVPEDMEIALKSMQQLVEVWNKLTPIQRNEWICWVMSVKKTQTRAAHILRLQKELLEGKRTPCCWPGCPHRKEVSL
jgi:uncharacterized protein YdeI (YjbR/CyaY-like superfamily)